MAKHISLRVPFARRVGGSLFACVLLAVPALCAGAATADTAATPAQWHGQNMKFDYVGFTALYTCDGLEDKVRAILLAFGARKDVKVKATGCENSMNHPSKFAWVAAEFSSLTPASDPTATGAVKADWAKVQISPDRPFFMGRGECELVEQMRPMLEKGFTLRNAEYYTFCTPHQVTVADYHVTAEVLKAAAN